MHFLRLNNEFLQQTVCLLLTIYMLVISVIIYSLDLITY